MGATSRLPTPLCEFPFINFHVSFFGRRRACVVFQVHALSVVFLTESLDEQAVSQKCKVTAFMIIAFGISSRGPLPEVAEVGSPSPGSGHPSVPAVGMFLLREEPGVRFAQRSAQGWAVWGEDNIRCAASCPLVTLWPCWPDVVSLWPLDLGSPHEASVCVPMPQLAQRLAARHGARPGAAAHQPGTGETADFLRSTTPRETPRLQAGPPYALGFPAASYVLSVISQLWYGCPLMSQAGR